MAAKRQMTRNVFIRLPYNLKQMIRSSTCGCFGIAWHLNGIIHPLLLHYIIGDSFLVSKSCMLLFVTCFADTSKSSWPSVTTSNSGSISARFKECWNRTSANPHLSQWRCFRSSSTALQRRLRGGHLGWEHLIKPGWIATLCGSAEPETIYLEEGKVGKICKKRNGFKKKQGHLRVIWHRY